MSCAVDFRLNLDMYFGILLVGVVCDFTVSLLCNVVLLTLDFVDSRHVDSREVIGFDLVHMGVLCYALMTPACVYPIGVHAGCSIQGYIAGSLMYA